MDHLFALTLDPDIARGLSRNEYKAVTRWLRMVRREIEPAVESVLPRFFSNLAIYGIARIA